MSFYPKRITGFLLFSGTIRLFASLLIVSLFHIYPDDIEKYNDIQNKNGDICKIATANKSLNVKEDVSICENSEENKKTFFDKTKGIYFIIGHYTYFPELNSEKPIYIVNEMGREMIPGWRDIVSFKDMREIGLFGDIWAGIGLHCGKRFSIWSGAGGGIWKIHNENRYGPLNVRVDLTGIEYLTGVGLDYYPFGKTHFPPKNNETCWKRLKQIISSTKPYFSLCINYSHFEATGKAKIGFLASPIRYTQKKEIDIISISPFFTLDTPLSRRTDLFMGLGYLFGLDIKSFEREHKNEIEGPVVTTGIKINF